MIYSTFDQAYTDLGKTYFDTPPADRDRVAYAGAKAGVNAKFAQALADEYAPDLPATVQNLIFEKAWADGHSAGYYDIENCYIELAEFATSIRNA